jgi:predicted nucleic acid-binding protein
VKVLLDTNVLLDAALERHPFFLQSDEILLQAETEAFEAFISASTFSDLYYIIRKQKGHTPAFEFVHRAAQIYQIATVDTEVISLALRLEFSDFEDAIQCATASVNQLDAIVTRDIQGFARSPIQIFTPSTFIQSLT